LDGSEQTIEEGVWQASVADLKIDHYSLQASENHRRYGLEPEETGRTRNSGVS
jgi:hypothetical protein